ncbi:hypothetical protein EVAR_95247_1 [Eumeta japonica]|uniref:Uncharacterized protein n=1 Tax=Eumeta variegata TaxID=151549 RepID=A0A4C1UL97_EUMVA|nr:hypothetical protein EVAR_95247_1 [Eumeta japonica]
MAKLVIGNSDIQGAMSSSTSIRNQNREQNRDGGQQCEQDRHMLKKLKAVAADVSESSLPTATDGHRFVGSCSMTFLSWSSLENPSYPAVIYFTSDVTDRCHSNLQTLPMSDRGHS